MSAAPWYIYLIGLVVALPIFFLLGTGLVMLVRSVIGWVSTDNPSPIPQPRRK